MIILGQKTVLVDVLKDVFVLMDKFYQTTNVSMKVHVQVSKVPSHGCLCIILLYVTRDNLVKVRTTVYRKY